MLAIHLTIIITRVINSPTFQNRTRKASAALSQQGTLATIPTSKLVRLSTVSNAARSGSRPSLGLPPPTTTCRLSTDSTTTNCSGITATPLNKELVPLQRLPSHLTNGIRPVEVEGEPAADGPAIPRHPIKPCNTDIGLKKSEPRNRTHSAWRSLRFLVLRRGRGDDGGAATAAAAHSPQRRTSGS